MTHEPSAIQADVPVVAVTLLEDRGLVQRRGPVTLPPGRSRLTIEGLAPVLTDKSLAARLEGLRGVALPPGVTARDVSVRRWRVHADQDRPAALAELHTKIRAKAQESVAAQRRQAQIEAEAKSLAAMVELTLDELAQDVAWGRESLAQGEHELSDMEEKIRVLGRQACAVQRECDVAVRELADLRELAAAQQQPDADARASMLVEFVNPTDDAQVADLVVDYLVPGALWRPCHTARLSEENDAATVHLQTEACVWQATGEDWTDVELSFSTERPSLGVSPPTLTTDHLRAAKRGAAVHVAIREQTVHTAGLGQEATPTAAQDDMPGIDDGGDALALRARAKATVLGDGRPHRVTLDTFETPADAALVCVPELASAVLLRTRQTNRSPLPLLAGPVDLVRDSGVVGRTSILYVAPGERFDLGWGPDRALRVSREVEHLDQSRRALSSWTRKPRRVTIRLSNLGAQSATIEVKERVATSEIEKVEVEVDSASHHAQADADGMVTWTTQLRGFGREALELAWTLVVHDDVAGL